MLTPCKLSVKSAVRSDLLNLLPVLVTLYCSIIYCIITEDIHIYIYILNLLRWNLVNSHKKEEHCGLLLLLTHMIIVSSNCLIWGKSIFNNKASQGLRMSLPAMNGFQEILNGCVMVVDEFMEKKCYTQNGCVLECMALLNLYFLVVI